tara:strand:+ start:1055 stop:1669 length:615 start_codon:yes stop_codon:yes gene_type:complete
MELLTLTAEQKSRLMNTSYSKVVEKVEELELLGGKENIERINKAIKNMLAHLGEDSQPDREKERELREQRIDQQLEEYMAPYIQKFNGGELNGDDLKYLWVTKVRELSPEGHVRTVDTKKLRSLRVMKMQQDHIKFYSKRLGRFVAIISEESQRAQYTKDSEEPLIFTVNEVEALIRDINPENNQPKDAIIALVKEQFGGEILA